VTVEAEGVPSERDWAAAWRAYFHDQLQAALDDLAAAYPEERSLTLDVLELYDYDEVLAEALFAAPDDQLRRAERVLRDLQPAVDRVHLRLENNPALVGVADLAARHLGELVSVDGIVGEDGRRRTRLSTAVYVCGACGERRHERPRGLSQSPPAVCTACDTHGTVAIDEASSTFVDTQLVSLRDTDPTESVSVPVHLDDDSAGALTANSQVVVTGVLRPESAERSNCFTHYLSGLTVETAAARRDNAPDAVDDLIDSHWTTEE
jgi:replicative DNA helicase Mcm